MSGPHYIALCPGCAAEKTVTRDRVETGRPVFCAPCGREMPVTNIGERPVKPTPLPSERHALKRLPADWMEA